MSSTAGCDVSIRDAEGIFIHCMGTSQLSVVIQLESFWSVKQTTALGPHIALKPVYGQILHANSRTGHPWPSIRCCATKLYYYYYYYYYQHHYLRLEAFSANVIQNGFTDDNRDNVLARLIPRQVILNYNYIIIIINININIIIKTNSMERQVKKKCRKILERTERNTKIENKIKIVHLRLVHMKNIRRLMEEKWLMNIGRSWKISDDWRKDITNNPK